MLTTEKQLTNEKLIEILQQVKAKIETGWCKAASALNKKGDTVSPNSEDAYKWCLSGAISSVLAPSGALIDDNRSLSCYDEVTDHINRCIEEQIPEHDCGIVGYNDLVCKNKQQMIDMIDFCINNVQEGNA